MNGLKFIDPTAVDPRTVDAAFRRLGRSIPPELRRILLTESNGGQVEPTGPTSAEQVGLTAIFGVARQDGADIELRLAEWIRLGVADGFLPFADAEGGNLVLVSTRARDAGSVWFWDHELEGDESMTPIAPDLESFLSDLAPISDLPEPEVARAWIDPDFLAEFGGS